jgi:hypothetical protein
MDLMTPELRSAIRLFPLGSQERLRDDARVLVKYFFPSGRYTFIATEAEEQDDDVLFFGFCVSPFGADCDEWGYTCLSELQSVRVRGLTMERDLHVPIGTRTVRELLSAAA